MSAELRSEGDWTPAVRLDATELDAGEVASLIRPCLRVWQETVWIDRGDAFSSDMQETRAPVLGLSFEYEGFTVRASDPRTRLFCGHEAGMVPLTRDRQAESRAQLLLESFGAVELELLEDHGLSPDSEADYLVRLEGDQHTHCAFSAYAVPQLEAMGWKVTFDDAYPYRVLDTDAPWYARVEAAPTSDNGGDAAHDPEGDWFSLELGIEVEGHRVNLLPALLAMLDDGQKRLDLGRLQSKAPRFIEVPGTQRHVEVPAERYRTLLRVLAELYQGDGDGELLRFPATRAVSLAELDEVFAEAPVRWDGGQALRERGRALACASRTGGAHDAALAEDRPPQIEGLQATLRPYQRRGVAWLQRLRASGSGGVLADDMGLGKTLQTIAHLCLEHAPDASSGGSEPRASHPSLVVAPTSLMGNWRRELARFAPHLKVEVFFGPGRHALRPHLAHAHVVITSYSVLLRDEDFLLGQPFHVVVLDEAQAIKNPRSKATRLAKGLDSQHRLCLSGTPIENSLDELWSLFDFLMPEMLGSEQQFRCFYKVPIEQYRDAARTEALRSLVRPYVMRRMKEEVAPELPPKTEVVRPVQLRGKQRELYESIRVAAHAQVRSAIRKKGLAASTLTILDALMRLRQLCCDPRLVRGEAARRVHGSAKLELLMQLLEQQRADGRRVLVFSQFTSMLSLIAEQLDGRGVGYASLTGATRQRDRAVRAFEGGEVDVFLISLKAGGTGLNLVSADTVIHYDPWWNPAAQQQATDRAYRIGQDKPVFVYNLIVAGSVEERMLGLQQHKRKLARSILGRGDEAAGQLGEAEVEHLLAPLETG